MVKVLAKDLENLNLTPCLPFSTSFPNYYYFFFPSVTTLLLFANWDANFETRGLKNCPDKHTFHRGRAFTADLPKDGHHPEEKPAASQPFPSSHFRIPPLASNKRWSHHWPTKYFTLLPKHFYSLESYRKPTKTTPNPQGLTQWTRFSLGKHWGNWQKGKLLKFSYFSSDSQLNLIISPTTKTSTTNLDGAFTTTAFAHPLTAPTLTKAGAWGEKNINICPPFWKTPNL